MLDIILLNFLLLPLLYKAKRRNIARLSRYIFLRKYVAKVSHKPQL